MASNTGLPEGKGLNKFMEDWLAFSQSVDELPIGALIQSGTTRELSDAELAAYVAPFPDGSYQASPKRFPLLIPLQPDNPGVPMMLDTWAYLGTWEKPFLTVFGDQDPIAFAPGAHLAFQRRIPGAQGQAHVVLEGPNHFIQEDAPTSSWPSWTPSSGTDTGAGTRGPADRGDGGYALERCRPGARTTEEDIRCPPSRPCGARWTPPRWGPPTCTSTSSCSHPTSSRTFPRSGATSEARQ